MKRLFFALLLTALFFTLLISVEKTEKAADFSLEGMDGKIVKLSELLKTNKLVVVDFWASWCVPCKKALPKLNEIDEKYKDVVVVTITIDKPKDQDKAKKVVKSNNYKFLTLFDPNEEVKKLYKVTDPPKTFLINQKMEIVYEHTGYNLGDEEHLIKEIDKNLPVTK